MIFPKNAYNLYIPCDGGYSSAGRASDCGSEGRGFDPHYSPHKISHNRDMAQLVAHSLWERGVVSSSLAIPTIFNLLFLFFMNLLRKKAQAVKTPKLTLPKLHCHPSVQLPSHTLMFQQEIGIIKPNKMELLTLSCEKLKL